MKDARLLEENQPLIPQAENRWNIFNFSSVSLYIGYFALCSSTMLLINKVTIHFLPCPTFVLVCQLGSAALVVQILDLLGIVHADKFEWDKVKKFAFVAFAFLATLYFNIKVLQFSNVETFITFRSSTPIVLTAFDYLFLGRSWPNVRSWICLVFLLLGSVGYVLVDEGFKLEGYFWLCMWYCFFVFDQVYIKHVCDNVKMTTWGRVLYTNTGSYEDPMELPGLTTISSFLPGGHLHVAFSVPAERCCLGHDVHSGWDNMQGLDSDHQPHDLGQACRGCRHWDARNLCDCRSFISASTEESYHIAFELRSPVCWLEALKGS
ncbi:hypothetical protein CEUSTIGMA_g4521.t1 [Chlamydomonas eustigma]|uniref:Sugar phosphate transporter domain-containing protein n=1 Tax=Chlamydomonas eustigma TaxID=1157962 RepID=A0A250X1Z9_9CHLO|nr:hypothetical protein CEUSTIGMA_g4521.t1 [Chlamydomonas eustigma]|eukprot:GAX77075.1 hypothetical protein CEUSTIGMA_g4521.t1 [Chlamydomonas eustigma]